VCIQLHRAAGEHWIGLKRPQFYSSVLGLLRVDVALSNMI